MEVLLAFVNVQYNLYPILEVCSTHHDSKSALAALPPGFSALLSDSCMEAKQGAAINRAVTFAPPYKTCLLIDIAEVKMAEPPQYQMMVFSQL